MMPKPMRPPITLAKMRSSGRYAPRLIRIGRSTLSRAPSSKVQTSSTLPPYGVAGPVEPAHRRRQHEERAQLRDAKDEDDRREHRCARDADDAEADAGGGGLDDRRDDHPERDGADGLLREHDGVIPAVGSQPAGETSNAPGRCHASRVKEWR
jgi:hypothetical protein